MQSLRETLNAGKELSMLNGLLINGKGPYRYNTKAGVKAVFGKRDRGGLD